ncbi:MAG: helix-turn-helix domain-containing protein [Candidatus Limnocylindria bacterium]
MTVEPELLKVEEAASFLNIGRSKAYGLASRGELPGVMKVGHSLRVSRRALLDWIAHETGKAVMTVADR